MNKLLLERAEYIFGQDFQKPFEVLPSKEIKKSLKKNQHQGRKNSLRNNS